MSAPGPDLSYSSTISTSAYCYDYGEPRRRSLAIPLYFLTFTITIAHDSIRRRGTATGDSCPKSPWKLEVDPLSVQWCCANQSTAVTSLNGHVPGIWTTQEGSTRNGYLQELTPWQTWAGAHADHWVNTVSRLTELTAVNTVSKLTALTGWTRWAGRSHCVYRSRTRRPYGSCSTY